MLSTESKLSWPLLDDLTYNRVFIVEFLTSGAKLCRPSMKWHNCYVMMEQL